MSSGIIVIMVVGTFALLFASWWAVEMIFPRYMAARTVRQVAMHKSVVEGLDIALSRAGNDPEQTARLSTQRAWHLAQLAALAPAEAAGFGDAPVARAA